MAEGFTDVTFEIDDAHYQRFKDGMAAHFGYQETIDGEPNPEGKGVYAKRKMRRQMIQWVKRAEARAAVEALPPVTEININE